MTRKYKKVTIGDFLKTKGVDVDKINGRRLYLDSEYGLVKQDGISDYVFYVDSNKYRYSHSRNEIDFDYGK